MPDKVRIALDAMGGDHGATVILPGADISLTRHPDIEYLLYGNTAAIEPVLNGLPRLKARSRIVHTEVAIRMDDKPSQALRYGRWKSSMWLAIDAVKKGEADVAVSAGNIALKTAEGTARQFAQYLKDAMNRTWAARLGYLLSRQAFRTLRDKMDPRKSNGGVFLGLNGIVIKSHGGADAEGFASAIDMGYDMFRYELLAKIGESMARDMQANATARVASGAIS